MLLLVLRIRACLVFPMLGSPSLRLLNSMLAFDGIYIALLGTIGILGVHCAVRKAKHL